VQGSITDHGRPTLLRRLLFYWCHPWQQCLNMTCSAFVPFTSTKPHQNCTY